MSKWTRIIKNVPIENNQIELSDDNALASLGKFAFKEAAPPEGRFVMMGWLRGYASTDNGETWESIASGTDFGCNSVTYGTINGVGRYIAVGYKGSYKRAYYSLDGATWTAMTFASSVPTLSSMSNVCYGKINGEDMFLCHGGYLQYTYILKSTDGTSWHLMDGQCSGNLAYGEINGQGMFVATGSPAYYSTDGNTWTECQSSPSQAIKSIFANNRFVGVGVRNNCFAYSTDGVNWTSGELPVSTFTLETIAYGNGKFIGTFYNSSIHYIGTLVSTDGTSWMSGPTYSITFESGGTNSPALCYGNNKFIWCGTNCLLYWVDGTSGWVEHTSPTTNALNAICHGDL